MENIIFELTKSMPLEFNKKGILYTAANELSKYANVTIDHNGNVIGTMGYSSAKRHIMLDAHIDKIGMIVTAVCKNGFLKVAPRGGVDCRVLPGSTVKIFGKKEVLGIVCSTPPHLTKKDKNEFLKVDELLIDVGMPKSKVEEIIELGSYVEFTSSPKKLLNGKISAAGLDNRAGVCALLRCAQMLSVTPSNSLVSFVFSNNEEINCSGAKTAGFGLDPQLAIVVDTTFGTQPDISEENKGSLGAGPMVGISPCICKEISNSLINIAKTEKIPYQLEIMGGKTGTNADHIAVSKCGVKTGLISIPLRYMHTPYEVIDMEDIENTAKLLSAFVANGGE